MTEAYPHAYAGVSPFLSTQTKSFKMKYLHHFTLVSAIAYAFNSSGIQKIIDKYVYRYGSYGSVEEKAEA